MGSPSKNASSSTLDHTVIPFSIAIKRMSEIVIYKANECKAKVGGWALWESLILKALQIRGLRGLHIFTHRSLAKHGMQQTDTMANAQEWGFF